MNTRKIVSAALGATIATTAAAADMPVAPAALPASIQAKTALWLDASKNLVTDGSGNVVAWLDAREESVADAAAYEARVAAGSWTYPRAVVYKDGAAPSGDVPVGASAPASFGGKPYVDFGEYNDNRWMLFVDAAGARRRVTLTGYAGYIGFGSTAGFVVGDVNDPDILAQSATGVGDNGAQYFHKGYGGNGNDAIFAASNGIGRHGETRKNGHVVKSTQNDNENRHVRNGWEVFVQNGPNQEMFVSTLFNNGNFKASVNASYTDRQGGGKIAEIMLFSEMLTQEEVAEVEAYLRARWQGGSGSAAATLALAAGDTLSVAATAPAFVGDIAGAGAIEKTGSSSLTIDRGGRLAAGALALREGSVVSYGKRAHHAPLLAIGGKTVTAAAATLSVQDAGDADTFTVNESTIGRRVSLAAAESGVKKIAVSKAAAVLAPSALPPTSVATVEDPDFLAQGNLIRNGSFEDDKITGNSGKWQANASRWTVNRADTSSTLGIEKWGSSTWANNNSVVTEIGQNFNPNPDTAFPDGSQCAFVQVKNQQTNSLSQVVEVPRAGLYRLSAFIRCRQRSYSDSSVVAWFTIDGKPVVARRTGYATTTESVFALTNSTPFNFRRLSVEVPLSAASHTVAIAASNPYGAGSTDRALCVDDVRLEPVAEGDFVLLRDPGFETMANQPFPTKGNGVHRKSSDGFVISYWTISNGGYSRYPSSFFWNNEYADADIGQSLYLGYTTSAASSASQTIVFPKAGRVRLCFRYANQTKNVASGAARASGQMLTASIGGTAVFSATVTNENFTTAYAECDVSAGSASLAFTANKNCTILDDVRIEYVGGTDRIVEDTAFADGSSTWTMDGAVAESDAFGLRELVFTGNASATATFTVPTAGHYLLSFQSRGRPLSENGTDGVYHNYRFYSHNLNVRVDGEYFANYYNEAADIHPVEMRLPYLPAGEHTVTFVGSSDSFVATTAQSRISDVTVTPLATGAMADWSGVEFELADGATIAAELGGKVRLGKLRVDGAAQYGGFTAANCDFVTGAGTVEVLPDAFIMVVR